MIRTVCSFECERKHMRVARWLYFFWLELGCASSLIARDCPFGGAIPDMRASFGVITAVTAARIGSVNFVATHATEHHSRAADTTEEEHQHTQHLSSPLPARCL